jgi:hypothetical protein
MIQSREGFALVLALIMTAVVMSLLAVLLISSPIFDNTNTSKIEKIKASDLARLNLENFINIYNCDNLTTLFNAASNITAEDKFCAASSGIEIDKIKKVKGEANYNFYMEKTDPPTYIISCAWLKRGSPVATKTIKYSCEGNSTIKNLIINSYRRY